MANISEVSNFDTVVYEIATNDPVEGGPGGISNVQAQALANRTKWLKDNTALQSDLLAEVATRAADDAVLAAAIVEINKFLPKNRGFFSGLNIGSGGVLTVGGNITSAVAQSAPANQSKILINMQNAMSNINYKVKYEIESLGTADVDVDNFGISFKKISTTQFSISIAETTNAVQNLKIHLEVISLD